MAELPIYVIALTRVPFPSKEPFPSNQEISEIGKDEDSEEGRIWHEGATALSNAPGLKAKSAARIREEPEQILLFTTWESQNAYTAFSQSSAFSTYIRSISIFGPPSPPQLIEFRLHRGAPDFGPKAHNTISIRTVYFPTAKSEQLKNARFSVPSFFPIGGRSGPSEGRVLLSPAWKSWILNDEEEVFQGKKDVESLVILHWWNGFDGEKTLLDSVYPKSHEKFVNADGVEYLEEVEGLTNAERWNERLTRAGALGWRDEHCCVTYFPEPKWSYVKSRKETAERRKAAAAVDADADELA